jgi:hypothetical protein
MENGGRRGWSFEIQAWHIFLMLAVQLLGLGAAYGRITQQQEQFSKDLGRIESQRVISKDEFDEWKAQLTGRLDRMENKIDREYIKGQLDLK